MKPIFLLFFYLTILMISILTFVIGYTCLRWVNAPEDYASLVALLWSCYPIAMSVVRQDSSGS
jgi:hypothetical protein